ncbi:MFS transporter (macronuclear) [Tetrahymena thermophila SB210]|uniref:MFS transporter n=1 Tax=Tetrahymena thermophila (strain SB210) TaxID=312017 RepID=Q245W9_TETTS|nr:MFS transporter [Tetrahymena thermophila SB210]EAS03514.3 MFS transporter [Tetrahymena thermophila SB210]|eukprot:XP_001023759.3 MFS transporter [Tetrahymena thermophila SB210]
MEAINKLDFRSKGKLGVLGGFLIHSVLGSMYIWSNLCEYVSAYYVQQQHQDLTTKQANIVFPISLLFSPLGIFFGVRFADKYGQKKVAFLSALGISLSVILSSFATKYWVFVIFYGITNGISMGFIYMIPLDNAQKFFPNRKGTVYGVIICGYGLGSLMFNWVLYYLINPSNIKAEWNEAYQEYMYPPQVSVNLPHALLGLGLMYFVIASIGSLLIIKPSQRDLLEIQASMVSLQSLEQNANQFKEVAFEVASPDNKCDEKNSEKNKNQQFQEQKKNNQQSIQNEVTVITWQAGPSTQKNDQKIEKMRQDQLQNLGANECSSLSVALKQKELYVSLILGCIGVCYGLVIASNYKSYGLNYHNDDKYYYYISTISSFANGSSRFFWGYMMDKIRIKRLIILNLLTQILINITLPQIVQSQLLYAFCIICAFFCYCGWYVIMPTHCYRLFGSKIASQVYGVLYMGFPLSGMIQQAVVLNFSWQNIFIIIFGIQAFGLMIVNAFSLNINWRELALLESIKESCQKNTENALEARTSSQSTQKDEQTNKIQKGFIQKNDYQIMDYEI